MTEADVEAAEQSARAPHLTSEEKRPAKRLWRRRSAPKPKHASVPPARPKRKPAARPRKRLAARPWKNNVPARKRSARRARRPRPPRPPRLPPKRPRKPSPQPKKHRCKSGAGRCRPRCCGKGRRSHAFAEERRQKGHRQDRERRRRQGSVETARPRGRQESSGTGPALGARPPSALGQADHRRRPGRRGRPHAQLGRRAPRPREGKAETACRVEE